MKADLFPGDEKYKKRMEVENAHMDDTALRLSVFGQRCFYNAFAEFDDQDIEMSLNSANLVSTEQIPIFAAAIKSAKSAQTGAKGYAGFYADSTLQSTWQA